MRFFSLPVLPAGDCLLCRRPAECPGLCRLCLLDLERLRLPHHVCSHCALPLNTATGLCGNCLRLPPDFSASVMPFCYYYPVDYLVGQFKYAGCSVSARLLCHLLGEHLQGFYRTHPQIPLPELVLSTPLYWRRQFSRGFNQSELLARHACRRMGLTYQRHLLRRNRATRPQQGLSRRDRSANVKGAFTVANKYRPLLAGKRVAVVDDVVTTATTVREVSRVLVKAGAADVHIWALARTPD